MKGLALALLGGEWLVEIMKTKIAFWMAGLMLGWTGFGARAADLKTWVLADGSMFEASVKQVVPGAVTFTMKDGSEKVADPVELSQRSRALVAEVLGLGMIAATPNVRAADPQAASPGLQPAAANPPPAMPATAPTAGDAIDATETARLMSMEGSEATVVGTVKEVPTLGSSGHRLIEFEGSDFSFFIHRSQIEASAGWILDDLPGKRLQVKGKIENYRDKPQIRGSQPDQLTRVQ